MRLILNLVVLALIFGSVSSCVSKKKFEELEASKASVDAALAEAQGQIQGLEEANTELQNTLESEKERLNNEMATLRNELDATKGSIQEMRSKLNMTEEELADLKQEINGIFDTYKESGLSLEERNGRLTIMTEAPVNYASGSSRLDRTEREAIAELAETLKNNPDVKILVEGHTDDKKVIPGASFRDNWELSTMRAMSVVRELLREGVDPAQVAAVGRGEYMPAASNDSADGRSQNRRTVILPDAQLGDLMSAGGGSGSNE